MAKKRERSVERRYDPSGFDDAEEQGRKAAKTDSGRSLRRRNATTADDASSPAPPRGGPSRVAQAPHAATPAVNTPGAGSARRGTMRSSASRASRANVSGTKAAGTTGQSRKRSTGTRGPVSKGRATHGGSPPLESSSSKKKSISQRAKPSAVDPDETQGIGSFRLALRDVEIRAIEQPVILEDSEESSDEEPRPHIGFRPDLKTLLEMKAAADKIPAAEVEKRGEPDQNPLLYSRPLYPQEHSRVTFNLGVETAKLMDEAMKTSYLNGPTEDDQLEYDFDRSDRGYPSMETTPEVDDG